MTKDEAYKILDLDIDSGATEEQIKDGFKKAAKAVHPDLHPDDKDATVKMQNVNAAKEFLDNLEEGEDVEKVYEHQSQTYQQQTTGQDTQREGDDQRARQQARDERAERMRERDRIYEQERNEREAGRRQESDEWKGTYSENVHSQESKDVGDYYDKTAPQFSDYLKFTGDSDDLFYQRLSVLIKQMKPNSKILQDFIDTSKEMKTTVSEEQIIKKLVREATTLAKLYYFSHKRINPNLDLEYYSEVKKSFILVMEIFEDVKSFSGLNTELSLIRQALETKEGKEMFDELKGNNDMTARFNLIRAILTKKPIEEIKAEFDENKMNREWLNQFNKPYSQSTSKEHFVKGRGFAEAA